MHRGDIKSSSSFGVTAAPVLSLREGTKELLGRPGIAA